MRSLLVRADASPEIGAGHVMRCVALAQAARDAGWAVQFACARINGALAERMKAEGFAVTSIDAAPGSEADAAAAAALANRSGVGWIVVDGYHFGPAYIDRIKAPGMRVLLIDDYAMGQATCADIVLDQNLGAYAAEPKSDSALHLFGPAYCLLRKEFRSAPAREAREGGRRRILVTLGAADTHNVTQKIVTALLGVQNAGSDIRVIAGALNPHLRELNELAAAWPERVTVMTAVADMPAQYAWCDIAVSAAGSTVWELARMGVPMALVVTADNQKLIASSIVEVGVPVCRDTSPGEIAKLAEAINSGELPRGDFLSTLVDGEGASRVVGILDAYPDIAGGITLRKAVATDCCQYWVWANDPGVRSAAFSADPIPLPAHISWFAQRLSSPDSLLLIAESACGLPVGQIRFDSDGGDAVVDFSVDASARGRGIGAFLLTEGARLAFVAMPRVSALLAKVKSENAASRRAFEKAGFTRMSADDDIVNYELKRPAEK